MEIVFRSPKDQQEWNTYYDLRYRILREPLGQSRGSEKTPEDEGAEHVALFLNNEIKAIGRLDQQAEKVYQVRFVAVESDQQGKGLGRELMMEMEDRARKYGAVEIVLHARENALPFYLSLGYQVIEKSHLLFGQIQHYFMHKSIS